MQKVDENKKTLSVAQLIVAIITICSALIFVGITFERLNTVEAKQEEQSDKIEDLYKMKEDISAIKAILNERLPAKNR